MRPLPKKCSHAEQIKLALLRELQLTWIINLSRILQDGSNSDLLLNYP
jgi:hypothetical protein